LEHPVDVFTPASRNKKKQEIPGDVFSLALEKKTASKSSGPAVK